MVMVSESQSGNLSGSPFQFLQFPTMTVAENVVKKKFKIKIPIKVEAGQGTESCEFGQKLFMNNECSHSNSADGNKKFEMNKSHNFVLHSSDDPRLYAADNLKAKLPMPGSNKRGPPGLVDGQREKRQKMDRSVKQQCSSILKTLMTHVHGWVFNVPVDPVKLKIPDYFSVISEPMDLGTIKRKLEKNEYVAVDEFAADVRLTFSNAMTYNPPHNQVHHMANELKNIFNRRWKLLEAKWDRESKNVEQGFISSGRVKNSLDRRQIGHKTSPLHISLLLERLMPSEEKEKLREELLEASMGKMPERLQGFLRRFGLICEDKTEVGIDALDNDTLWELKRVMESSLDGRAAKAEPAKMTQNGGRPLVGKTFCKGTDCGSKSSFGSAKTKPMLRLVASKCGSCGRVTCQCSLEDDCTHASSSDISSERSMGQNNCGASKMNFEAKNRPTVQMSKSDPDSDGPISALDEENMRSSPHLSTVGTTAASGEGWNPLIDVQLSPKKALRAAILKSRFADTILKAKQKRLLDHSDKADPVKMQQEKERLERQQLEEKARIEAQIRAAEVASRMRAEAELKMQREREREAARIALQEMEKTVEIDNLEILKDLEMLSGSGCPLGDHLLEDEEGSEVVLGTTELGHCGKPLERLGLFIKEDYMEYEDEEAILYGDGEEGEIFS